MQRENQNNNSEIFSRQRCKIFTTTVTMTVARFSRQPLQDFNMKFSVARFLLQPSRQRQTSRRQPSRRQPLQDFN
ncbi:18380_t:CDS:2, partial [Racocetra fulgida]